MKHMQTGHRPLSQRAAIAKMSRFICYYRTFRKFNVQVCGRHLLSNPISAITYICTINRVTTIKISRINITNNLSATYYSYSLLTWNVGWMQPK